MTLIDLLRAPWAIVPDRLAEIQSVYEVHLRGEKIDVAAIEARLGRPLSNEQQAYEMRDGGVAVLPISGVISPKANLFTQVSGGASAQMLVKQVESMAADHRVKGVVLAWDSPGGAVQGIPALEKAIKALAEAKPTVSVCDGTMASAAYWCGSAANAVFMSGETDTVGSIGVVASHTYDPRNQAKQTTEIVAGKYKRIVSDNKPLSAEGERYLQAQVDEIYSVFLETVAANRRVTVEQVLTHMADGRVFIGRQAMAAGLVDGVATVDTMAERMAADPSAYATRRRASIAAADDGSAVDARSQELESAGVAASGSISTQATGPVCPSAATPPTEGVAMTPEERAAAFAAEHPDAAAALRAEGSTTERARIQAVRELAMPGHEALIEQLAFDGSTSAEQAARQVLAAERTRLSGMASARAADAPSPVQTKPEPDFPAQATVRTRQAPGGYAINDDRAELDAKAKAHMAANPGVDYIAALKHIQQGA